MESEETEVRRLIFEAEINLLFSGKALKKIKYEEFQDLDKEYDHLRDSLRDDSLHGKFIQTKNNVREIVREIKKIESR